MPEVVPLMCQFLMCQMAYLKFLLHLVMQSLAVQILTMHL